MAFSKGAFGFKMRERIKLEIEDMNESGQGIAKREGMVYFVNGAVLGDFVESEITLKKKNYMIADAKKLLRPSPKRKKEYRKLLEMPYGLSLQSIKYEEQLVFKEKNLYRTLDKIAGIPIYKKNRILGLSSETRYRNKGVFPVRDEGGKIKIGAFERASHSIVEVLDNPAMPESYAEILQAVKEICNNMGISAYDEARHIGALKFIIIRSNAARQHLIALVFREDTLRDKSSESRFVGDFLRAMEEKGISVEGLIKILDSKKTNFALGGKSRLLYGKDRLEQRIEDAVFQLSINAFFQVSEEGVRTLYREVFRLAELHGNEQIWDIYCGVGSIGIYLLKQYTLEDPASMLRLRGLEYVKEACENAEENAFLNGISGAYFEAGKAEELLPSWVDRFSKPDLIILDPPRKGVDEKALRAVIQTGVSKIVYVSCKASTLARDLKLLYEAGYECLETSPVDLFPMSMHTECIALLSKPNAETHIAT